MKRRIPHIALIIILFANSLIAKGGNPPKVKWVFKTPFEHKDFIENKGQYTLPGKISSKHIYYGTRQDGLQYYFTQSGIWVGAYVPVKRTEKEIEELKSQTEEKENSEDDDDKQLSYKLVEQFHSINFINSNKACYIMASNEISQYYNFEINGTIPVVARGYKRIRYVNLYPGIDMEVYFPADSEGFKYLFIVHPGGDVSQIKMQYSQDEKDSLSRDGNIIVESSYGEFVDHAPVAYMQGNKDQVTCTFMLTKGTASFKVGAYNSQADLIIDPWITTPKYGRPSSSNSGYDVDWDNAGNCYIYGGTWPWQVEKFNSSGTWLWSYSTINSLSLVTNYGGFAVDRFSQSVYIIEGYDPNGAKIVKLNSSGSQTKLFSFNPDFNELWRIAFSHCTNEAVIAAGGTAGTYQGCYLDTNLINLTPVNILSATNEYHDMWGLALDNYGYAYMIPARTGNGAFNNIMVKVPLPSLTPTQWKVKSGYHFREVNSVGYARYGFPPFNSPWPNGYNGMTVSDSNLYTYDGNILKQWNTQTGQLKNLVNINNFFPDSFLRWGGLTSDECDNIFVGSANTILQYDAALKNVNIIAAPDTVYDVVVGPGNILYAVGQGFVEAIPVALNTCYNLKVNNQINNDTCIVPGSAIISVSGAIGTHTTTWNTTPPQKGDTATNLLPGQYIATIIGNPDACFPVIVYDTVQILQTTKRTPLLVDSPSICFGDSSVLRVSGAVSYTWSPSVGLSATTGDSIIAKPASTTTYTIIGTNRLGCLDTSNTIVTINPPPVISIAPQSPVYCIGESAVLTVSGAKNYTWSPSIGLNTTTGSNVTVNNPQSQTIYTITGTDSLGCKNEAADTVFADSLPKASFSFIQSSGNCNSQQIQFTNTSIGGSTYLWNFGDGLTDNSSNPLHNYSKAGVYTIELVVTTANGCSDTTTETDSVKSVNYGIHIANAFAPGSVDEGNNIFKPAQIVCSANLNYIFRIYSRWGELLYETNDPNQGWDGTYKGKMEPLDVYVYYIQYTCGSCTQFIKGNVTLLK